MIHSQFLDTYIFTFLILPAPCPYKNNGFHAEKESAGYSCASSTFHHSRSIMVLMLVEVSRCVGDVARYLFGTEGGYGSDED